MKLQIYSIFDSKAKIWSRPMFAGNEGMMLREWMDGVNDERTAYSKHPEDYTLFKIGDWDDEQGTIYVDSIPTSLGCAINFKKDKSMEKVLQFNKDCKECS